MGNALKAVKRTSDELTVSNYMVLFGDRDLEGIASDRRNGDGSSGEYFTKSTKFDSPYTDAGALYVDFEHSLDVLSQDDILGRVDWKTARIDDRGLFVQRVLNRRSKYVQWLEEMIDSGLIGNSSEAIGADVVRAKNGEIKRWPLRRDSLTVCPMQSQHITTNALAAAKSLAWRMPSAKALVTAQKSVMIGRSALYQQWERTKLGLEIDLMLLEA